MPVFDDYPVYNGSDLGIHYTPNSTVCKVWAPKATVVKLRLYQSGEDGNPIITIELDKLADGLWAAEINRDVARLYYTFQVCQDGKWLLESPDIYAKVVGINGRRGMIADLQKTNPPGWTNDTRPPLKNFTDIILYELHIRDLSMDVNSGIVNRGKFLGLTEAGTKNPHGESTGLDHLKELGVTHVHLLPTFDFISVDESRPELNEYNWGYDPQNYNVPEGSYSTDPYDGTVRIREFKQMVKTLHENGIRVILDVVYNHTASLFAAFNQFAPHYYYRQNEDGSYSNASGCGNETASERPMMRKFMIDSVRYWVNEYHIDGFRFDLMGIHDIETMNEISTCLHCIDPTIFVYGEGWTAGPGPLPEALSAVKKNTRRLKNIAVFSDDLRDALRGPFGNDDEKGFASGGMGWKESVKFGIVASTRHPQVNYKEVNYSKEPWANAPAQVISYVSCHDDHTLFDRLKSTNPGASESDLIKMDKLSHTVVLTSQGVSFIHAGAEMLRTKHGISNSYKSPDAINQLDWNRKTNYKDVFNYFAGLVMLRKNHPAFRMTTAEMIRKHLLFGDTGESLIVYQLINNANNDHWKNILVSLNGSPNESLVFIPDGSWTLVCDGNQINEKGIREINSAGVVVPAYTAFIMYQN